MIAALKGKFLVLIAILTNSSANVAVLNPKLATLNMTVAVLISKLVALNPEFGPLTGNLLF